MRANRQDPKMEVSSPKLDEKEFYKIKRGNEAKYVNATSKSGQKAKIFYVRSGNSSKALSMDEVAKYISERFH